MILSFGSNGSGQLGIGHQDDVSEPTEMAIWRNDKATPESIVAGGNHTLVLDAHGNLYTLGASSRNLSHSLPLLEDPGLTLLAKDVMLCAANWEASTYCTKDGIQLFTCGKGAKGELGHGPETASISASQAATLAIPGLGVSGLRIVDLASGMQHTVIVLSDGSVYGWGNGRKGQLGEPAGIVWTPRKFRDLGIKVVKAQCGREFTYLVGDSQEGAHAILGSDKWAIRSRAPAAVPGWLQVGACWGSILVLFQDGSIRSWGRNDHGQLAPDRLPPIRTLACGSEHSLVITKDRRVIAWGWGEHGNCGPDVDEDGDVKQAYACVNFARNFDAIVIGCGAGCATSWVWTRDL